MTEKRFKYSYSLEKVYDCNTFNGETTESYGTFECCDMLNQLNDENKQLKHFKEKVFNLIDEELKENEEENNHVDTATYYANKQTLNKLKKELQKND